MEKGEKGIILAKIQWETVSCSPLLEVLGREALEKTMGEGRTGHIVHKLKSLHSEGIG